jgi:hypothetical protein
MYETPIIQVPTINGRLEVHSSENSFRVDFFRDDCPQQAYRCIFVPSFNDARSVVTEYEVK